MFNEITQELKDTKEALSRKEGYVSRLEDYFDRQLDGFEYTKDALPQERSTVQNLTAKVTSLEQGVGERDGKNQALIIENAEIKRQLEDVKAKYAKSKASKKKMDKLRSQWAGIASTFGADIK